MLSTGSHRHELVRLLSVTRTSESISTSCQCRGARQVPWVTARGPAGVPEAALRRGRRLRDILVDGTRGWSPWVHRPRSLDVLKSHPIHVQGTSCAEVQVSHTC